MMSIDVTQLTDNDIERLASWSPRTLAAAVSTAAKRVATSVANFATGMNASGVATNSMSSVVISADLAITENAGTSAVGNSAYMAAVQGNLVDNGDPLAKTHNYCAGVHGLYSVTNTNASTYPRGAVLGSIGASSTTSDGAFVAVLDGDAAVTTSGAAFKVKAINTDASSGFDFGLDLQDAAQSGITVAVDKDFYLKAPVRLVSDVVILVGAGAPTNGGSGTGLNVAGPGSIYVDTTGANAYIQSSASSSPTWKLITRAA